MNRCDDYIDHYRVDAEEFDYFDNQDPTDAAYEKIFRKFIVSLSGSHATVVDIGSGSGWTGMIPHERVVFVDLSEKNLAALKSTESAPVLADANVLPFADNSLEFVIASEIIEHLNDPAAAAAEIWRVLKPGGKAVVSTPYKERLRYTLCIHCNRRTPWNSHLHSFDRDKLLSLFPGNARKGSYVFGSKILILSRAPRFLRRFPLWVWRIFDRLLIAATDKAQHIIMVIEK